MADLSFSSFIGCSGHLTRGLCVLPSGNEFVCASGTHLVFCTVQERQSSLSLKSTASHRILGTKRDPTTVGSQSLRSTMQTRIAKAEGDSNSSVIMPGCFVRPTLVSGHTLAISCLRLSPSGRYLATGTCTSYGFSPELIVWDVAAKRQLARIETQHINSVIDIAFSPDEKWFVSIGESGWIIAHALEGISNELKYDVYSSFSGKKFDAGVVPRSVLALGPSGANGRAQLVCGSDDFIIFVELDLAGRLFIEHPVRLPLKRSINCLTSTEIDGRTFVFAGTDTGDIIKIDPVSRLCVQIAPSKRSFPGQITAIEQNTNGNLIVGTSASKVYLIRADTMAPLSVNDVPCDTGFSAANARPTPPIGSTVSLFQPIQPLSTFSTVNAVGTGVACLSVGAADQNGRFCYGIGPNALFRVDKETLEVRLLQTYCPSVVVAPAGLGKTGVSDIALPVGSSKVTVSACGSFVSVWSTATGRELIRISVPNVTCTSVLITADGSQIISGWGDGSIRSHTPQTGKELWCIGKAHQGGVTTLCEVASVGLLLSGGSDAKISLWRVTEKARTLIQVVGGHKGPITSLYYCEEQNEVVSSCVQGVVQLFRLNMVKLEAYLAPVANKTAMLNSGGIAMASETTIESLQLILEAEWAYRAEGGISSAFEVDDGSQVFCVGQPGLIWLQCGEANGALIRILPLEQAGTACKLIKGATDADDKIAVGCKNGELLIYGYDSGEVEKKSQVVQGAINSIAVCNEDAVVVAAGADGTISVYCLD